MADGGVNVVVDGVSAVDHQTVHELHGLGPLTPQLTGHHHLTALSAALHDETQHTVARPGGKETNVSNVLLQVQQAWMDIIFIKSNTFKYTSCESTLIFRSYFQVYTSVSN